MHSIRLRIHKSSETTNFIFKKLSQNRIGWCRMSVQINRKTYALNKTNSLNTKLLIDLNTDFHLSLGQNVNRNCFDRRCCTVIVTFVVHKLAILHFTTYHTHIIFRWKGISIILCYNCTLSSVAKSMKCKQPAPKPFSIRFVFIPLKLDEHISSTLLAVFHLLWQLIIISNGCVRIFHS